MFDPSDITKLLLSSRGSYDHANWWIDPGKDSTLNKAWIASVHEHYHSELNNTTLYGFLLSIVAYINQESAPQNPHYTYLLNGLVEQCRTPHEVYATFLSVQAFNFTGGALSLDPSLFLAEYPNYQTFFKQGEHITRDFKGTFLKEKALTAAIFVCFQNEKIVRRVLDNIENFTLGSLQSREYPNKRWDWLGNNLPTGFLKNSFDAFCKTHQEHPAIPIFEATEEDAKALHLAVVNENDRITEDLIDYFFDAISHFAETGKGFKTASRESNFQQYTALVTLAHALCPNANYKLELNTRPFDINYNVFLNFQRERFLISTKPLKATLFSIEQFEQEGWSKLSVGDSQNSHYFFVSQMAHRLKEQFLFNAEDSELLDSCGKTPLLFLQRRGKIENHNIIELVVFENPKQLMAFLDFCPETAIIAALSQQSLQDKDWLKQWISCLERFKQGSIILDLPLDPHFQELAQQHQYVCYYAIRIQLQEDVVRSAMLLQGQNDTSMSKSSFYLIFGSESLMAAIQQYFKYDFPGGKFVSDKAFFQNEEQTVVLVLSHIFNENYFTDFLT